MVRGRTGVIGIGLNPGAKITRRIIGREGQALTIVDDFLASPNALVEQARHLEGYAKDAGNFYPGMRKAAPQAYVECLEAFISQLLNGTPRILTSLFSIASQDPRTLKPIQSIPHFDTCEENQLGAVHYLCGPKHGGTSFYRHRSSGFERITPEREGTYIRALEREATTHGLPKPGYINGDTALFERFEQVEARFNRLILYPSNLLHAGDIREPLGERLTVTSFILVNWSSRQLKILGGGNEANG